MSWKAATLAGLDTALTSLALGVERLGERTAWRFGRWARSGTMAAHEAVLGVGRRLGWTEADPDVVEAAWSGPLREAPAYPAHETPAQGVQPVAAALRRGVVPTGRGAVAPLASLTWRRHPDAEATTYETFQFCSLEWIEQLLEAHQTTRDPAYLHTAQSLTARWIEECLYSERVLYVWDDHIAAVRAIVLCRLWHALRASGIGASDPDFRSALATAILRHGYRLSLEAFYRPEHNHGVTQAYALLATGLLFRAHPRSAGWIALARERLEGQVARNVSSEGIHREHSPFYHFYVFRQLYDAERLARDHGVPLGRAHCERLAGMLAAGAHILKPQGGLPALGDTHRRSCVLADPAPGADLADVRSELFRFSASRGAFGRRPPTASALYPDGGLAFSRSGWGERERFCEESYLAVRIATFPTTHIHWDVLSFEWSANGRDVVVDSGGPYSYGGPLRRAYFVTTRAHNTVTVDDANQTVGAAVVRHWIPSGPWDYLEAEHELYPGVRHRRALLFLRSGSLIVADHLEAAAVHRYTQRFHLDPSLAPEANGLRVFARRDSGPGLQVFAFPGGGASLRIRKGEQNPMQGWVCDGDTRMLPGAVLEYGQSAAAAEFVTLLVAERSAVRMAVEATCTGTFAGGSLAVRWRVGGTRVAAHIGGGGSVAVEEGPV